jgi:hypothetical protein
MFNYFYFKETDTHVLLIDKTQGPFHFLYNYMQKGEEITETSYKTPNQERQYDLMYDSVYSMGEKQKVPQYIMDKVLALL